MDAFIELNRERSYVNVGGPLRPDYIKEHVIRQHYKNLLYPISYEFFKVLIQALDDAFIDFSIGQIKDSLEKK